MVRAIAASARTPLQPGRSAGASEQRMCRERPNSQRLSNDDSPITNAYPPAQPVSRVLTPLQPCSQPRQPDAPTALVRCVGL